MTTYIGTAPSRVDGHAKVTGAAKCGGEFNTTVPAHAGVVASTIAKGPITRIDAGEAVSVEGVIDVLTHLERLSMTSADSAYKGDVAPASSPFGPLYGDCVWFSGQPVALMVSEEPEIAHFAALLVRVEYDEERSVADLSRQRDAASVLKVSWNPAENLFPPSRPRDTAAKTFATAETHHRGKYVVPTGHHNSLKFYASTVIFEAGGKLTIYDKTQGLQSVQRYVCGVFGIELDDVCVLPPFVARALGSGLHPQFQVALAVLAARAAALGAPRSD
jgi:xanthine dehydrogenase YagR molybdenum-binding subunit